MCTKKYWLLLHGLSGGELSQDEGKGIRWRATSRRRERSTMVFRDAKMRVKEYDGSSTLRLNGNDCKIKLEDNLHRLCQFFFATYCGWSSIPDKCGPLPGIGSAVEADSARVMGQFYHKEKGGYLPKPRGKVWSSPCWRIANEVR